MNESVKSFDVLNDTCHYQSFVDCKKPIFKQKNSNG